MFLFKLIRKSPFYGSFLKIYTRFITKHFHTLYYGTSKQTWENTYWFGTPLLKCPMDLWIYQEIIHEVKPDVILECGTKDGGSARFMAHLLDILNHGRIITVDIAQPSIPPPAHPRIEYILGSSTAPETVSKVKSRIQPGEKVMVILDSDHRRDHVLEELKQYKNLVNKGSYLIVEDSNVGGHPVYKQYGPGPMEAIVEFMKNNNEFVIDKSKEKFYLTFNPSGYLKRI